ncbi:MAG TPA: TIGR00282 family metallophosphoesterase [Verrucomicrobiae bacterium]|nr:TIGR00282 family metallophosphoesterase [Verrucomicrobiae bacterium]
MNILYIGDVMGEMGLQVIEQVLPELRESRQIDLVIAQAENVTEGRGISLEDFKRLQKTGVDFCTGGNWSLHHEDIIPMMNDLEQPIIRPANYVSGTPGLGWKYVATAKGKVLVASLLGKVVGKDADKLIDNPLQVIDRILEEQKSVEHLATVVNLHGDYSSEKVIIGHYLDGRATLVAGDHWHVPTADARVLPKGTAHITDVGMCGSLNSSLGITFDSVVPRWRDGVQTRNVLETAGPKQFNAVLVKTSDSGLADSIVQIRQVF